MREGCRRAALLVVAAWILSPVDPALAQIPEVGPPPGQLVTVDGRSIHLRCSGTGSPAVILEAGAASFAIDWTLVQREVVSSTRVSSYDRAGHGWGDPAPGVLGATVVSDLHALIPSTGVIPPFVMVGASAGGLYVREYQAQFADEVAGLVLVDPASEDRLFTILDGGPVLIASLSPEDVRRTIPPGPMAIPRRAPQTGDPFDRLPPELYASRVGLDARLIASVPDTVAFEAVLAPVAFDRQRFAALRESRGAGPSPLGDLPLVVLTRGVDSSQGQFDSHRALARLSANSRHVLVAGAGHEIHLFQPEAVVQAILDVVSAVRSGEPLARPRLPSNGDSQ